MGALFVGLKTLESKSRKKMINRECLKEPYDHTDVVEPGAP